MDEGFQKKKSTCNFEILPSIFQNVYFLIYFTLCLGHMTMSRGAATVSFSSQMCLDYPTH